MEKQFSNEDEVSLKVLILKLIVLGRYLLSKWLIIAMVGLVGGAAGLVYAYFQKPIYTAELTFVLEDEQSTSGMGGYASIAGQFGIDVGGTGGGIFVGDNLLALMKTQAIISRALLSSIIVKGKQQTLAERYIYFKKLREKWKNSPDLSNIYFSPGINPKSFSLEQNELMRIFYSSLMKDNLSVDKKDKKSNILSIKIKSEDEIFSKEFAESLAKEVSDLYIETKTKKASQNVAILQHQADSVKKAFNNSVLGVASSTDANPNPNLARQVLKVPSQRGQFDVQVNQAILTQLVQNLEVAKVSLRKETPLIQVIDTPVLPLPKENLSKFMGFILGLVVSVTIGIMFFMLKRFYKEVMA